MSTSPFKSASQRGRTVVAALMVSLAGFHASTADAVSIIAQTMSCEGETGVATFESTRLFKIQSAVCADPGDPTRKLQQVLLKSDGSLTAYELVTVTNAESARILARMRDIEDAELNRLERPDVLIENRLPVPTPTERPVNPDTGRVVRDASTAVAQLPPVIRLADPPMLAAPRSSTSVITGPDSTSRVIVGTARADAGLYSVTVNGAAQVFDDSGLFTTSVPIAQNRTPVSIVAVDKRGQSSAIDFQFVRESPVEIPARPEGDMYGSYHAILVANNQYLHMDDLATPSNDAKAIAELLEDHYGFEVRTLLDANRYQMLSALNDARRTLTENDNLLVYFAGHGAYDRANNRGHWLPVDAEADSTANWVSTIEVTDIVNTMSARHVLVVADSCYSGSLARSTNTELDPGMSEDLRHRWLKAIAQTRSRHVLTSGGIKPVVDDGGTGHSVFANALIEVLSQGSDVMESSVLSRRVKQLVQIHAERLMLDQTPQYAQLKHTGHEFGEFLLVRQ